MVAGSNGTNGGVNGSGSSSNIADGVGFGSAASITEGVYFISGCFVYVADSTILLDKYTNTPDYRVGLTVAETFVTSTDDTSLLDNATGSSNANATGAHRFKITLTL